MPVMAAVKDAEARLLQEEDTKNYVGIAGDAAYRAFVPPLVFGADSTIVAEGRVGCVQTPGGTGALKVGNDLLNSLRPGNRIWMSSPTWANHIPISQDAGLEIAQYPYFRESDRGLDFDAMMSHLDAHAKAGEVILLHACCHNPTGVDLTLEQWAIVAEFVRARQLLPFLDAAYQGMGIGFEKDLEGLRLVAAQAPEMLVASSFSKNFGIYRERTGALSFVCKTPQQVETTMAAVQSVIRSNYSMPPSHGARIVETVFSDEGLKAKWRAELEEMRERIAKMRTALREKLERHQVTQDLAFITNQKGMFSYTGLHPDQVSRLREEFGIYIAGDGRINVAGLTTGNLDIVAEGFATVMKQ
ncbi:MAG: aromatic amino acid transaminase [Hyphomicrobiales bacterium]